MQYAYKSAFRTAIACLVIFSALVPIRSYAGGIGGSWEGQVAQDDPPITYSMEMTLHGNAGHIHYPSLLCGGKLEFIKVDGAIFSYREHLTFGKDKCIDGGIIQLSRHAFDDNTSWAWRWDGGGISVGGVVRGSNVSEMK